MFFGAKKNIFLKAVELRNNMTMAESVLWEELRNRKNFRYKWRRQHPVDIFIVDFYCHRYKLVIEVDGEIHQNLVVSERDAGRQHEIEKLGITILRFSNKEILEDTGKVLGRIIQEMRSLNPL